MKLSGQHKSSGRVGLQGTDQGTAPGGADVPDECRYGVQCGGWHQRDYGKLVRHPGFKEAAY